MSRAASAEAAGRSWRIERYGLVRSGFRAIDQSGAPVGELKGKMMGHSETLRWAGREYALRGEGLPRGGCALLDGERSVVTMTPLREGKRPLDVTVEDPAVDPGLLLFMAFIVQAYADDASFVDHSPGV